jgi:Glucodextranase, domain B
LRHGAAGWRRCGATILLSGHFARLPPRFPAGTLWAGMSRNRVAFAVLSAVLFASASAPASSLAATPPFATSTITAPANGADLFWDQDNGTGAVTVSGTVSGPASTAQGYIVCYSPEDKPVELAGPIDVSSGSFSANVSLSTVYGQACRVLMVPDVDDSYPGVGSDLSAYAGPAISVADQFSHSGNGNLYGYYVESGSLQWSWGLQSLGECPVSASYETDPSTLYYTQLFAGNACLPEESGDVPDLDGRSALQVDGTNAYVPGDLDPASGDKNLTTDPGFEPLQYTPSFGPQHTSVTIAETDIPTICGAPATFPPTTTSCPTLRDSGITVAQSTTVVPNEQVARVEQTFTNVSPTARTIDMLISQAVRAPESGEEPGFEFPGQTAVAADSEPDAFAQFPTGPGSIVVVGDAAAAPDEGNLVGAITYSKSPQSANFISSSGSQTAVFTMHYVARLAPGASTTYGWSFSEATSAAGLAPLEAAERDRFEQPSISIVSPPRRTVTSHRVITVSGRDSDPVGLSSLTVDGKPTPLGSNGTWKAKVDLQPGPNTLVAVVTNLGGITAKASETVTYRLACVVPRLRGDTLSRARTALRAAHCTAGSVVRVKSPRVRVGHVVRTDPVARSRRAGGARVRLYVSRGA